MYLKVWIIWHKERARAFARAFCSSLLVVAQHALVVIIVVVVLLRLVAALGVHDVLVVGLRFAVHHLPTPAPRPSKFQVLVSVATVSIEPSSNDTTRSTGVLITLAAPRPLNTAGRRRRMVPAHHDSR